jgi:catechol 2,3-dioxygenase-like lactoylglutathione lyase family enzyme
MGILTHVTVGTNDLEKARAFYDGVLGALGYSRSHDMPHGSVWGQNGSWEFFALTPRDGASASNGNGGTVGFVAPNAAAVAAAHASALAQGGCCEGPPGPREWAPGRHFAYMRDLDGNKLSVSGPE